MSEFLCGDETLFSLWPEHHLLSRPTGIDYAKDQQHIIPIVLLDDGRLAFKSENGQLYLFDNTLGVGGEDDMIFPLPPVSNDPVPELEMLSDAAIKSMFVHCDVEAELPAVEELPSKDSEDLDLRSLVVYNCQGCEFSSPDIHKLLCHIQTRHNQPDKPEESSEGEDPRNTNNATKHQSNTDLPEEWPRKGGPEVKSPMERSVCSERLLEVWSDEVTGTKEHIVFLCSECKNNFSSVEACKYHMIKEHNMVLDDGNEEKDLADEDDPMSPKVLTPEFIGKPMSPPPVKFSSPLIEPTIPPPKEPVPSSNQKNTTSSQSLVLVVKKRRVHKPKEADPEYEAKPHKCREPFCCRKFATSASLEAHVACHLTDTSRNFCCPHCSMLFNKWCQCAMHLWKAHSIDVDLFVCEVCNVYKTTTRKKLESHSKIHSDARPYKCLQCDRSFKQGPQLINHTASVHGKDKTKAPRWYMNQKCEICLKTYSDSKSLKKHMQAVHKKLKPYKCQICGHMSAFKAMLLGHMRQHTGEKPFACELCPFRTGDHNSLRRHVMRHTGKKPYRCPHCRYSTIQSVALKSHLSSRHPGLSGTFECQQCYFTTINETNYKKHMSDHNLNLIPPSEVEVFPENVAAAQLVYRSFGAPSSHIHCDVTASSTSRDGLMQTITISIPPSDGVVTDDEDTSQYLMGGVEDTGGITIPEEPEQAAST